MAFLNQAFADALIPVKSSGNIQSPISSGESNPLATVSGSNYSNAYSTSNTDNTTTLGSGSLLLRDGSTVNTGLQLGSVGGDVTFEGGVDDLKAAFSETLEAVKGLGEQSQKAVAESTEQSTGLVNDVLTKVLGSIETLAEGKQTEGESTMLKPVLIFAGVAVVAVVAALFFTKGKG